MLLAAIICLSLFSPIHSAIFTNLEDALGQEFRSLDLQTPIQLPNSILTIQTTDFTEILIWDENITFVGAANYLLRIDADLKVIAFYNATISNPNCSRRQDIFLDTCGNYFRVLLNVNGSLYTCYTNQASPECQSFNTNLETVNVPQFFRQRDNISEGFISPTLPLQLYQRNFITYIPEMTYIVTGSIFNNNELNRITVMNPFSLTYHVTTFYISTLVNMITPYLNVASFSRTAHNYLAGSFNYIYFMFYEPSNSQIAGVSKSRVARFCLQGPSESNPSPSDEGEIPLMLTFLKAELSCGDAFPSLVQDWVFVAAGSDFHYYAIFSSLDRGPTASYLCVYSLNQIHSLMDMTKQCGSPNTLQEITTVISPIALYNGPTPTIGHVGALFTQIQRYPFTFNSILYDIVYISLTDGTIIKYCINCPSNYFILDVIQVVPTRLLNQSLPSIDRLQLANGYLLAGGYTGLYRVPLQTCTSISSYELCLKDPMCYFDLESVSCKPATNNGSPTSSMLHFSSNAPLPISPTCSSLTGSYEPCTYLLRYAWNCIADAVKVTIQLSNGSNIEYMHSSGSGNMQVREDLNLDYQTVSSFSINPLNNSTLPASIPGPLFFANLTYLFNDCPPKPIICDTPVCQDSSSCNDRCSSVQINCSLGSVSSPIEFTYNVTSESDTKSYNISDLSQPIDVTVAQCGSKGCLFQTFSRNSTTGLTTPGSSYWLHLLRPLSTYTPVITVPANTIEDARLSFSADFPLFSTHTCVTPTIAYSVSSPLTITQCATTIRANGSIGADTSQTANVTVFYSQEARPPPSVTLNAQFKRSNDDCSYVSDVLVEWTHPNYGIPSANSSYQYRIYGPACNNTDFDGGVNVTGVTNYTCRDAVLSYNVDYSIYVVSYEPCGLRDNAINSATQKSEPGPPGAPQGLGYAFTGNNVTISWNSPLCINSDNTALQYNVKFNKSCSSTSTLVSNQNISSKSIEFELDANSGSFRYTAVVTTLSSQGASSSIEISFTFPDDSGGMCQACRVRTISISSYPNITWEKTAECIGLTINEYTLMLFSERSQTETDSQIVDGQLNGTTSTLGENSLPTGTYRISIHLNIQEQSNSMCIQCTSQPTNAFLYNEMSTTRFTRATNPNNSSLTSPVVDTCQDDKAYIIIGLAALAVFCAVGNIGCMFVACCVFCWPRRKVFFQKCI